MLSDEDKRNDMADQLGAAKLSTKWPLLDEFNAVAFRTDSSLVSDKQKKHRNVRKIWFMF